MQPQTLAPNVTLLPTTDNSGLILVVDDEEPNRTLLRDTLEARGHQVLEAENGRQALQLIEDNAIDVVLLDVMMPQMDGFEVCAKIKYDDRTAHIPVLMITALSERRERLLGIEAGANDFLNKPVDVQDMILRVGNALYAKRLFDRLQAEQERSERLLLNILPKAVAEQMKQGAVNIADHHPDVTILVADLVGFTTLSSHVSAEHVVSLLNEIFSAFDELTEKRGLEKIKTIGDAYMVVGGLQSPRPDHAEAIAELALDLRREIERFNLLYNTSIRLRMGISTGPVIAGVIGRKRFAYDLWGNTVNTACRLESLGEPGSIQVGECTYERLQKLFHFEKRTNPDVKHSGEIIAYVLGSRL